MVNQVDNKEDNKVDKKLSDMNINLKVSGFNSKALCIELFEEKLIITQLSADELKDLYYDGDIQIRKLRDLNFNQN
ncbi:uncharacterized protein KGF55_001967 [Candida pseudojiufengensis]|uniref:uncharacterized protein n=1 Tax=Candida pseudojiufengensis TaxID=497109 RepID=UPI002223F58B|nr:uncharacterized protein KGF55_001967 [Candida pseudojiufengensis]KAI5964896.1 hypothetical protein KGF55_001967 [Candida pseudojiufengensis]